MIEHLLMRTGEHRIQDSFRRDLFTIHEPVETVQRSGISQFVWKSTAGMLHHSLNREPQPTIPPLIPKSHRPKPFVRHPGNNPRIHAFNSAKVRMPQSIAAGTKYSKMCGNLRLYSGGLRTVLVALSENRRRKAGGS
jgi:hypothetical protein